MAAGLDFRRRLEALPPEIKAQALSLEATLFGSLSATGPGHGTDRAVLAGLLGWAPETLAPDRFARLLNPAQPESIIEAAGLRLPFGRANIHLGPVEHGLYPRQHPHLLPPGAGRPAPGRHLRLCRRRLH